MYAPCAFFYGSRFYFVKFITCNKLNRIQLNIVALKSNYGYQERVQNISDYHKMKENFRNIISLNAEVEEQFFLKQLFKYKI